MLIGGQSSLRKVKPVVVASMISDRRCIQKKGGCVDRLSPEVLAGCAEFCSAQVSIEQSYNYVLANGLPTGGAYHSRKGCVPWSEEPCKHTDYSYIGGASNKTLTAEACSDEGVDHSCPKECTNPTYKKSFDEDLIKISSWYSFLDPKDEIIMKEISTYGPVVASMELFNDFFEHPEEVYKRKSDAEPLDMEKHFKLIGWGKEQGTPYWLAVNTWDYWGDSKVFKIARRPNYPDRHYRDSRFFGRLTNT